MEDELLAWAPEPSAQPAGDVRLPGYSGFRLIAHGGEGTIYRARQDGLGRDVAVKVLQVGDQATLARFRRELEITVELGRQHPHIVTVLDTGTMPNSRPCIVMEFYERGSLHDRLQAHGPLPLAEVVAAGTAVADALAFAHGQGILHRDVKPQNVLVLPTSYVLADFGIARGADAGHSASLQMVSYRHAAPQMLDGGKPAAEDDLWSLGSTLFTLLEGKPPFASDNPDEDTMLSYLGRVRSAEPRPLTRPDVPPALAEVIERCLRKPREDRFPDAAALRAALSTVNTEAVPEFGPRPVPFVPEPPTERKDPLPAPKPDTSWQAQLADLTVRRNAPPPVAPPPEITERIARAPKRRGKMIALFGVIAVVIGLAIGLLANLPRQAQQAAGPAPTTTISVPSTTASVPQGSDPKFSPTLKRVEYAGPTIELVWTDPSDGKAQFVVVDVTGSKPQPLLTIAAGATEHTVENVDSGEKQRCFQIIAIGLDDPANQRGASARTCAVRN